MRAVVSSRLSTSGTMVCSAPWRARKKAMSPETVMRTITPTRASRVNLVRLGIQFVEVLDIEGQFHARFPIRRFDPKTPRGTGRYRKRAPTMSLTPFANSRNGRGFFVWSWRRRRARRPFPVCTIIPRDLSRATTVPGSGGWNPPTPPGRGRRRRVGIPACSRGAPSSAEGARPGVEGADPGVDIQGAPGPVYACRPPCLRREQ